MKTVIKKKRFKLRDADTGLFWGVSSAEHPRFNKTGKHWGNVKTATRNWADYNHHRAVQKHDPSKLKDYERGDILPYPDTLEMVEFEVVETCKGKRKAVAPKMEASGRLEAKNNRHYAAVKFARQLAEAGHEPIFIAHCIGDGMELPQNFYGVSNHITHKGSWTNNIDDELLLACFTDKDMIYVKMALHEFIDGIWDMRSGECIYKAEKK